MGSRTSPGGLRAIYVLSFTADVCASLVLVATVFLGTALGATPVEIGFIGGAYGIVYCFAPVILGYLSDKMSRKAALGIAFTGFAGVNLFNALLATTPLALVLSNGALGLFAGLIWPNVEAYLSERAGDRHVEVIGNFCVWWSSGFMLGPYLAGLLYALHPRAGFLVVIGLATGALLLTSRGVPARGKTGQVDQGHFNQDTPSSRDPPGARDPALEQLPVSLDPAANQTLNSPGIQNPRADWTRDPKILPLFMVVATLGFAFGKQLIVALFPNYAVLPAGLGWSEPQVGTVLFLMGLGRTLAFVWIRWRGVRDFPRLVLVTTFLFAGALVLVALVTNIVALGLVLLGAGTCIGFLYAGGLHLTLRAATHHPGRYTGLFEGTIGVGSVIAPILGGFLATWHLSAPYVVMGTLFLGLGALMGAASRALHAPAGTGEQKAY